MYCRIKSFGYVFSVLIMELRKRGNFQPIKKVYTLYTLYLAYTQIVQENRNAMIYVPLLPASLSQTVLISLYLEIVMRFNF